jgi:hypothetical protein
MLPTNGLSADLAGHGPERIVAHTEVGQRVRGLILPPCPAFTGSSRRLCF